MNNDLELRIADLEQELRKAQSIAEWRGNRIEKLNQERERIGKEMAKVIDRNRWLNRHLVSLQEQVDKLEGRKVNI